MSLGSSPQPWSLADPKLPGRLQSPLRGHPRPQLIFKTPPLLLTSILEFCLSHSLQDLLLIPSVVLNINSSISQSFALGCIHPCICYPPVHHPLFHPSCTHPSPTQHPSHTHHPPAMPVCIHLSIIYPPPFHPPFLHP